MRKILLVIAAIVALLFTSAAWAYAVPQVKKVGAVGPYEGTFTGTAYGEKGSRAPLTLELTRRGNQVEGNVSMGEGLYVNAGFCGSFDLPALDATVKGQTLDRDPRHLEASPSFDTGAFELKIGFESDVSASGNIIVTKAKVDLPWFCGRDPALTGILVRD